MLTLIPQTTTAPRRRGRPRTQDLPSERAMDLAIAQARYLGRVPVKVLAARLDLSPATVKRRARRALESGDPIAPVLRRFVRQPACAGS